VVIAAFVAAEALPSGMRVADDRGAAVAVVVLGEVTAGTV
jgi:hypothetical protein